MLLDENLRLTEDAHKTHRSFPFTVEEELEGLRVDFSFSPKVIEDRALLEEKIEQEGVGLSPEMKVKVKGEALRKGINLSNQFSLTLIGPKGFAGCAHRHASRQIIKLRSDYASPGFVARPIEKGEWKLILSADSLYRPADVKLQVKGDSCE